jgi:4-diphosphocytidyl-2-C-methyl-D-erythritol kinase
MIASAPAKLNLALVVGELRPDGKHELATVFQRIDLADRVSVEPADDATTSVEGFPEDTLVAAALAALGAPHGWHARIDKRIPVAAGLGGGSSDAAAALRLGSAQLSAPLADAELHSLAARLGADVPFFLREGPQLGTGDGTTLEPVALPLDYTVCLLLPRDAGKTSTRDVYAAFDRRTGAAGFDERVAGLQAALGVVRQPADLRQLPPNDLASSPHAASLRELGAFRADVSGAGPAVYGLFEDMAAAECARDAVSSLGEAWIAKPAW